MRVDASSGKSVFVVLWSFQFLQLDRIWSAHHRQPHENLLAWVPFIVAMLSTCKVAEPEIRIATRCGFQEGWPRYVFVVWHAFIESMVCGGLCPHAHNLGCWYRY